MHTPVTIQEMLTDIQKKELFPHASRITRMLKEHVGKSICNQLGEPMCKEVKFIFAFTIQEMPIEEATSGM